MKNGRGHKEGTLSQGCLDAAQIIGWSLDSGDERRNPIARLNEKSVENPVKTHSPSR